MEAFQTWLKPPVIWLALGLIMVLLEFANPGIVIIFFGIGAWIVALVCLFLDISLNIQLLIFLIVSVSMLVFLRRWFKELFHSQAASSSEEDESFDDYFGKHAVVTREISAGLKGKIEFHGTYWDAESFDSIPEGATVEIIDKKNITFIVKPL